MKRKITVYFVDFWDGFCSNDNFLLDILKQKFDVIISSNPEYLFFSVFGTDNLKYNCIKIFYTGENQAPDFNITDYAIGFERMEFGDRYLRFPYYCHYKDDFQLMNQKHHFDLNDLKEKEGFCSFVYSNNNASSEREKMFNALSSYKKVSSGGRFLNNIGGPVADKNAFQSKHKFSIAFENCSHDGYVTEKLVQAFAAKTIPIYYGDPRIADTFNSKAFINVCEYPSIEDVVNEVARIDSDDDLYLKMMQTPALIDGDRDSRESNFEQLSDFLLHIFDQPLESAQRYSREYWGKRYLKRIRQFDQAYRSSPRGIAETIYKTTLWEWRRESPLLWKIDRIFKK